jgi:hypothetical protein
MRTTITLDDDIGAKLAADARRSGRSFKEVVNHYLRLGLNAKQIRGAAKPFRVRVRDLKPIGTPSFDNVEALLDQLEGGHRR